jgi:hypothetical protein
MKLSISVMDEEVDQMLVSVNEGREKPFTKRDVQRFLSEPHTAFAIGEQLLSIISDHMGEAKDNGWF